MLEEPESEGERVVAMEEEEEERGPLLSDFLEGEAEEEGAFFVVKVEDSPREKSSSLLSTVELPLFLEEDRGLATILLKFPPLALGDILGDFREVVEGDLRRPLEVGEAGESSPSPSLRVLRAPELRRVRGEEWERGEEEGGAFFVELAPPERLGELSPPPLTEREEPFLGEDSLPENMGLTTLFLGLLSTSHARFLGEEGGRMGALLLPPPPPPSSSSSSSSSPSLVKGDFLFLRVPPGYSIR